MRSLIACGLAVLLWAGVDALAQGKGQGKGQGKDARTQVREDAGKIQGEAQDPAKKAEKNVGKAGKEARETAAEAAKGKQKQAVEKGKKAEKLPDAAEAGKAKGKGAQKQLGAFQKQLQHEQAKHMERAARLARIRELAVQKGDTETVARVDKLIAKEQQVYDRKLKHMQGQPRATKQAPAETETVAPVPTVPAPSEGPADTPDAEKEAGNEGASK